MKSFQPHTGSFFSCLAILSGVLFLSILPVKSGQTDFSPSQLVEHGIHTYSASGADGESSSSESAQSGTIFDLVLKETPKQKQNTAASNSLSVLTQGSNPPEPDSKEFYSDWPQRFNSLLLLKKEHHLGFLYRAPHHNFSFLLSLPGDIAINAP